MVIDIYPSLILPYIRGGDLGKKYQEDPSDSLKYKYYILVQRRSFDYAQDDTGEVDIF